MNFFCRFISQSLRLDDQPTYFYRITFFYKIADEISKQHIFLLNMTGVFIVLARNKRPKLYSDLCKFCRGLKLELEL